MQIATLLQNAQGGVLDEVVGLPSPVVNALHVVHIEVVEERRLLSSPRTL